jgi:hypothetical protein
LNFDNPEVHAAMFKVVDFWLDLGVDGLRLDAVPYLYERDGTSCENLPETHAFLKSYAPMWMKNMVTACCWPRRTCGRRTPWRISARAAAMNATWRFIFR